MWQTVHTQLFTNSQGQLDTRLGGAGDQTSNLPVPSQHVAELGRPYTLIFTRSVQAQPVFNEADIRMNAKFNPPD